MYVFLCGNFSSVEVSEEDTGNAEISAYIDWSVGADKNGKSLVSVKSFRDQSSAESVDI